MTRATTLARRTFALLAWLAFGPVASAQQSAADAQARAVPPPGVIELHDDTSEPVPLGGRARWLIETSAAATPQALEATGENRPWALRRQGQSYLIDGKVLWVQFDARVDGRERWYLEVGASGVDRVQLFYRGTQGQWIVQEAGDARPVSAWPLPGRLPTFELAGHTDAPVRYWLRVEHERVDFAAPLVLYDQSSLIAARETEQFLLGGYFSLAALIALVSAANAVVYRDRNFAAYAVYVASLALGQLAYLGVGAQHLWVHALRWNEMSTFLLPGISGAAALWFARTVTEPARYSRALDLGVWALIAAILSAVALDTMLVSRQSFLLVVLLTTVAVITIAVLIAVVWRHGEDPHVRLIALGFLPVLLMALFPLARGFNLIPVGPLTRYGISIGAAMEMPILFYALSVRGSRRREAQLRAAALSRTDALTGLADTRVLLQRLEAALARCATLKHACAMLAVKIANQETIATEFGRDTADRVLVVAASLLRNAIADVDMAARVGDNEFVLLLEGPATPEEASSRAQQLVASGLRSSEALPPSLTIKFQVAVALLPEGTLDAQGSLRWTLEAVDAMRADTRKLIRALNF